MLGMPAVWGDTGAVWLEALHLPSPRSGSLPVGYTGKLVLLLNSKAKFC